MRPLDRLVVPGADAEGRSARVLTSARALVPGLEATYLHRSAGSRFGLEPVIEDLARTEDRLTARFALRRLEYRSDSVRLGGHALPWSALPLRIGAGLLGVLVAASLASRSKALGMAASV
jgi:hypothetical protein